MKCSGWLTNGGLACALVVVGMSGATAQREGTPQPTKGPTPTPEAVKLVRLQVQKVLKQYDKDKDGKLSRKDLEGLFDRLDGNGDGALDREELTAAVETLSGSKEVKADQRVITFLREHDVNKDGKFS